MAKKSLSKSRHFKILLYPDNEKHQWILENIINANDIDYIGILHKGDEESKEHYHLFLSFPNPRKCECVAAEFGFFDSDGNPDIQFCRPVTGRLDNGLVYLTHLNSPEKEQYLSSDLFGTKFMLQKYHKAELRYLRSEFDMSDCVLALLDWIDSQHSVIRVSSLLRWACGSPYFKAVSHPMVRMALDEHNSLYARRERSDGGVSDDK